MSNGSEQGPQSARETTGAAGGVNRLRLVGLLLIFLALLAAVYGLVAYLGWQSGLAIREENARTALAETLDRQVTLAVTDVADGNYNLALTRLEYVLTRSPGREDALAVQAEARQQLARRLTPTPTPTPDPTATATLIPVMTVDPSADFTAAADLVAAEEWDAAIPALLAFQTQYPNFRRRDTDQMLYDSYVALGSQLLNGRRVETGLYYLGLAERLGDLPPAVVDQRSWAELYLTGIAFYEVDWGATVFYFRDLCRAAPFYQNACGIFYEALIAYADAFVAEGEYCPAEPYYREALQERRSDDLRETITLVTETCLAATPTPEVISDTLPLTGTIPVTLTPDGDQ